MYVQNILMKGQINLDKKEEHAGIFLGLIGTKSKKYNIYLHTCTSLASFSLLIIFNNLDVKVIYCMIKKKKCTA